MLMLLDFLASILATGRTGYNFAAHFLLHDTSEHTGCRYKELQNQDGIHRR